MNASSDLVRAISPKQAEEGKKWFALMEKIWEDFKGIAQQPGTDPKAKAQDPVIDTFRIYLETYLNMFTRNSLHAMVEKGWPRMLASITDKLFPHPNNKYNYNEKMKKALVDKGNSGKLKQWETLIEQLTKTQAERVTKALADDASYKIPTTQLVEPLDPANKLVRAVSARQAQEFQRWLSLVEIIKGEFTGIIQKPTISAKPQDAVNDLFQGYLAGRSILFVENSKHATAEEKWSAINAEIKEKLYPSPNNTYCYNKNMMMALNNDEKKQYRWQQLIHQLTNDEAGKVTNALANDPNYTCPIAKLVQP
ncbi:hypothetical protein CF326_g5804 [Tilletia indica]|nr:hypothetical protein CF326_g5804 [Tilletia indica]